MNRKPIMQYTPFTTKIAKVQTTSNIAFHFHIKKITLGQAYEY